MTVGRTQDRQALVIGSIVVVIGLIAASDTLYDQTQEIIGWAERLILRFPTFGMLVFVLLSMASAMVAFFSAVLLAPIAIQVWGPATSLVLIWIGWVAGGAASYSIGFFLGRSLAARLFGESRVAGWQEKVVGRTHFIHVLLLVMLVPSEFPGYILGIIRYRFASFLTAIAIGYTPHSFAAILLGDSFLKGRSMVFILIGAGLLLGALAYRRYRYRPSNSHQ